MRHLSLTFFGGFCVTLDGEPVNNFGSDKVRALLAYLAIESGHPHRRAALYTLFWPELSERKAAHNLSQTLLRLRAALRDEPPPGDLTFRPFLLTNRQEVQLNPASRIQLDVAAFTALLKSCAQHHPKDPAAAGACPECIRALQSAINLYQGELLTGLLVRGCPALEQWRTLQQEALQMQAVAALERLSAYHERLCEYDQVHKYALHLTALDPWCEEAHLQLMRALAAKGQVQAALEHFEAYRRSLADELGIEPSQSASNLYQQIRLGSVLQAIEPTAPEASRVPSAQAELRQITALVCSRCAAPDGDPEDQYHQMRDCRQGCAEILKRYGGSFAQRQGNQCLVYYGFPLALEDAPRRAVYAALEMAAADPSDPVRVSIHTGKMVAGEQRGRRAQDRDLVGDPPLLARAFHTLAQPGQVLLSQSVQELVRGWFELRPLDSPFRLENGAEMPIYHVDAMSADSDPFDRLASAGQLSPFTGRAAELRQLQAWLAKSAAGKGQIILVRGLPGIGKSRLVWELRHQAAPTRWAWTNCTQFDQNTGLAPLVRVLAQLLDVYPQDSPAVREEKITGGLAQILSEKPGAARMIALLMGLPAGPLANQPTPTQLRELMQTAVTRFLQRLAAVQPLVLVLEDLQWSDTETIDWIIQAFSMIDSIACTILLTARGNFDPPWLYRYPLNRLELGPLAPEESTALAAALGGPEMEAQTLQQSIDRSDGIPLYLEELIRHPAIPGRLIPPALRDLLTARLDSLGPARYTAQWAALLGRSFTRRDLQAVSGLEPPRLQHDLKTLLETGIIARLENSPLEEYTFEQVLLQETVRATMLRVTRQEHEQRIAALR